MLASAADRAHAGIAVLPAGTPAFPRKRLMGAVSPVSAETCSHQHGHSRRPVRGWLTDPDHQDTVVLPPRRDRQTRAGSGQQYAPRPACTRHAGGRFRQGKETSPVIRTRVTAGQSPTMTG